MLACLRFVLPGLACLALTAGSAQALPLGLSLLDHPDTLSQFIDVTYDAGTDSLLASGFALRLDDDGSVPPEDIVGGSFDLTATINDSGVLSAGSLTIGGTVAALGFNSGTLLTGNLTQFGFPNPGGGETFEFLFNVTGGDAYALYGSGSLPGGVLLHFTGFQGSFAGNFDNLTAGPGTGSGESDVAPVPEPNTLALILLGLGMAGCARRALCARPDLFPSGAEPKTAWERVA